MASIASPSVGSPIEPSRHGDVLEFDVEPFAPRHLPLVAGFSERYWRRPRTQDYYEWRYLESLPFSQLCLALTDRECVGMIAAFRKSYRIGGETVRCLETFDWHALPGLKGSGVGLRVMRAMMRAGERIIAIGGTRDVLRTLSAMRWQTVTTAATYELPLTASALVEGLRRRVSRAIPGERVVLDAVTRWFRPRRRNVLGETIPVAMLGEEALRLYRDERSYDAVQVPDRSYLRWLSAGYAGTGSFAFLYFSVRGRLRGWAATRTYDTVAGREAAILDVFAPSPDEGLYTWMVSEAACWLEAGRPRLIRARASCPALQAALRANRFRPGLAVPVHTWPANLASGLRWHITLNHTDEPLRPYREAAPLDAELTAN